MSEREKIDLAVKNAVEAQCRDDVCSRSTMVGLKSIFDFIPEDFVKAMGSFCGGTASCSGSCGAFCAGLLAVGLKYNSTIEEELSAPEGKDPFGEKTAVHFMKYRDRFIKEVGTMMCPEIHKKLFGRSYLLTDPKQSEEFLNLEGHAIKCSKIVAIATRIAAETILEDE